MNQLVETAPALPPLRLSRRQARCLAQSDYLEEAGSPALVRFASFTIGAIACGFLIWAGIAEIDEAAVSTGTIIPSRLTQSVQHVEGGVVGEILVREGNLVTAGQTLIKLNGTSRLAELNRMRARHAALKLKSVRLLAFASERKPDFSFVGKEYQGLVGDQMTIYQSQVKSRDSQRAVLHDQIAQREAELTTLAEQEKTLQASLSLMEEELGGRRTLHEQKLRSKSLSLDVQRRVKEARGDLSTLKHERDKTAMSLAEATSRLTELNMRLKTEALSQMSDVTSELAEVQQAIVRLEDETARLNIKAPMDGIINGLMVNSVGNVVRPGEPILEIVPTGKVVAEIHIDPRDIGHVEIGQPVKVKVSSFDFSRYGAVNGTLVDVSASTFVDDHGLPYYKATIWLEQQHVGSDPKQNILLPGMTLQADIDIGEKTLLEYILKPVYASIHSSFRER